MNKNGFVLVQAMLALIIVWICTLLVLQSARILQKEHEVGIDETLEKKWFYSS